MSGTGAGNDQPLGTRGHCRLGEIVIIARVGVEDGDLGECCDLAEIELRLRGVPADWRTIVYDAVRVRVAKDADLAGLEGLYAIGVGLGHFARRVDDVVEDDQRTLATRGQSRCDS